MTIVVSAVQPTGTLHLGNYLGSISNWLDLQKNYNCFFSIVDLHAITVTIPDPVEFKNSVYKTLAIYLASGLDPKQAVLFKQSDVSGHSELFWLLSCFTQIGKLNRMIQFKDKAGKNKEKAGLGLYAYPVLMAADILLYKSSLVPVGEDQQQHIELANEIAASFNFKYEQEYFSNIEALTPPQAKRIMSLRNGTRKMSKSDESDLSRINLTDDAELINKKIMKAKTDSIDSLIGDLSERPELKNLLTIFSSVTGKSIDQLQSAYDGLGNRKLKEDLAEAVSAKISPIAQEAKKLLDDTSYLDKIFQDGAMRANEEAERNLKEIKNIMGFIS